MAITASLKYKGITLAAAYIRQGIITGSKDIRRWRSAFSVYQSEGACWPAGRTETLQRPAAVQPAPTEPTEENPNPPPPEVVMESYTVDRKPSGDALFTIDCHVPYFAGDPLPELYADAKAKLAELGAINLKDA